MSQEDLRLALNTFLEIDRAMLGDRPVSKDFVEAVHAFSMWELRKRPWPPEDGDREQGARGGVVSAQDSPASDTNSEGASSGFNHPLAPSHPSPPEAV